MKQHTRSDAIQIISKLVSRKFEKQDPEALLHHTHLDFYKNRLMEPRYNYSQRKNTRKLIKNQTRKTPEIKGSLDLLSLNMYTVLPR